MYVFSHGSYDDVLIYVEFISLILSREFKPAQLGHSTIAACSILGRNLEDTLTTPKQMAHLLDKFLTDKVH